VVGLDGVLQAEKWIYQQVWVVADSIVKLIVIITLVASLL
jgi:hypothetical protein